MQAPAIPASKKSSDTKRAGLRMSVARVRHEVKKARHAKQYDKLCFIVATAMCEAQIKAMLTEAAVQARLEGKSFVTVAHLASGIASNPELSAFIPGTFFIGPDAKRAKAKKPVEEVVA